MKWTGADKRRRWFGMLYLLLAIGMFIWGQTIFRPHLSGLAYVCYWLVVFGFTLLAMITALLDMWVIRLRQRRSERDAAKKVFESTEKLSPNQNSDESP